MQTKEILETIKMIDEEYLDIRTITMGISLLDCMDTDIDKSCEKIKRQKILSKWAMSSGRNMEFRLLINESV